MTRIAYENWNPKHDSLGTVYQVIEIIEEYEAQGYILTLRQIYYQFIARDIFPEDRRWRWTGSKWKRDPSGTKNADPNYKWLGGLITKGRMSGMISWNAIEDRLRNILYQGDKNHYIQESDDELVNNLPAYVRFDYWATQPNYVEVWVEKEALGNVIERACSPLQVPYMSCKGYMSASAQWRAGQRFQDAYDRGKECHLIHLGDHDPSGIDMTRDNRERVNLFSGSVVNINRIALNIDQVEEFNPPPNPAKETDSRAPAYVARHGNTSWELDALEPSYIETTITNEVKYLIDDDAWDETLEEQRQVKGGLKKLVARWPSLKQEL